MHCGSGVWVFSCPSIKKSGILVCSYRYWRSNDENGDRDLKVAVGLHDVEDEGAKRHLPEFQDWCCAKKRRFRGSIFKAFELATEVVNQEVFADADLSMELVSAIDALAITQNEAMNAEKQSALLH